MALYQRHFGSIIDWVQYSENNHADTPPDHKRSSVMMCSKDWNGISKKEEAYSLMCKGWPDGLDKMKKIMEKVYNVVRFDSPQYEFVDKIEGCAPNIEAYLHGIPEDMHALEEVVQEQMPTFLTIQCEMFISCFTTPEQCMWAGACVFAAMEILKGQGCSTTLVMSHSSGGRGGPGENYWQSAFPIPNNLDMDTLAFLFTHPSVFRTIIFSMQEHEPDNIRNMFGFYHGGYYGYPCRVKLAQANAHLAIQNIVRNFNSNDEHNKKQAQDFVTYLVATKFESFSDETVVDLLGKLGVWNLWEKK